MRTAPGWARPRRHVARAIAARQAEADRAHIIFAAAPSQDEFLAGLVAHRAVDWTRVVGFHMDEYLGLDPDHPRLVPPLPARAPVPARRHDRRPTSA